MILDCFTSSANVLIYAHLLNATLAIHEFQQKQLHFKSDHENEDEHQRLGQLWRCNH